MKITKPKTNRNSSHLFKAPSRPAHESDLSSGPASGDGLLAPAAGACTPPQRHARPRLRTQLLSIANLSTHDDDHSSNSPHSTKASSRDRPSRSASLISRVSSNRCSTMRFSMLCDSRPAGTLDADYGSSPGGARPLESLREYDDADDATSALHDPEAWHRPRFEKPVIYATRRRSMFTPGVATRGSAAYDGSVMDPVDEDLPIAEAYSNYDRRSAPLFGLDLPGGFMPQLADQRASTPSDINYQLGCLKRGTLHITNGAASPVSSLHSGGYFSPAFETARSQAERRPSEAIFGNGQFFGDFVGVNQAVPPALASWADPDSRPASNPNLRKRGHRLGLEMQRSCHSCLSLERPVRSSSVAVLMDEANATTMRSFGASENAVPPIVKEYQSVVPSSPFITDVDAPSDDDAAAVQVDLFDEGIVTSPIEPSDEYSQPEETAAEPFDPDTPTEDMQATPTDQSHDWPLRNISPDESVGSSRASSSYSSSPQPMTTTEPVTKLSKTDSGYSSSTSLRSLHGARRSDTEGTLPVIFSRPASSIYTQEILSVPAVPLKIPPPVPPKASSSAPSSPGTLEDERGPAVPPKLHASLQQEDDRPAPISKSAPPRVEASRPEPPPKDTVRGHQADIRVPEKPLPPAAPKKLHKPLPRAYSQERLTLTVQGVPAAKQQPVPAVPLEMAARHSERIERLPGGPVSAADPERSLDIASGPALGHVSFPQFAAEEELSDAVPTKRRRRPSLTAIIPSFASRNKSGTASPAEISIDDDDHVAPHGCLDAVCLGASPYDAAVSPSRLELHVRNQDKPFLRQLRRVYKTKSMADMHSKAADGSELYAEPKGASSSSSSSSSYGEKPPVLNLPRPHSFCSIADAVGEPASEAVDEGCRVTQRPATEWPPPVPSLPGKLLPYRNGRDGAAASQYVNLLGPPKPPAKPGGNVSLTGSSHRPAMSVGYGGRLQDAFRRKHDSLSSLSALEASSIASPLASTSVSGPGLLSRRKPVAAAAAAAAAETARLPLLHQAHELNRRRHMAISVQT